MSTKVLLRFVVAFGLLAVILVFLGVNFVPRSSASSPTEKNMVYAGSDWIERHPSAVTNAKYYAGSDWIERHPSAVANANLYAGSDWIERHQLALAKPLNLAGSDYIERHPSSYYINSDWIDRHPVQTNP